MKKRETKLIELIQSVLNLDISDETKAFTITALVMGFDLNRKKNK